MKNLSIVFATLFLFSSHAAAEKSSSDGRFTDSGKGVIKDSQTGMMWTQKDSYVDLGHSVNWNEAIVYVKGLKTGGHSDWRLPTIAELQTIYEPSKTNKDIYGGKLRLDPIFAASGTYNYWSSETKGPCCALTITFDYGMVRENHREFSGSYGVRAVRK